MGFHVDTSGNIWSGTNVGDTFSSANPTFYVTDAGFLYAVDGELGGISITADGVEGSFTSTAGFQINSAGDATFNDVTARGTISGTVDTSLVAGSTGEFRSSSGTDRVTFGGLGGPTLFFVYDSSTTGKINAANDDFLIQSEATNDNLILRAGGSGAQAKMTLNANEIEFMGQASGTFAPTINIPHTSDLQFSSTSGTPGQVITKTNTGLSWQSTSGHTHSGYSFPNSGTLLSSDNHSHSGLLDGNHLLANNPHSVYVQNANHTHANFLESADLSAFISNNNNIYNSVVDHTDITANQGGGSAHGLSLSGVNAAVLHVNDNSLHTNHNHNYGLAEDPHDNNEHTADYITNNNANAHHGNTYSFAGHGHAYANSSHNHNYAASSHNHDYAANSHNHAYASAFHTHSGFASSSHSHNIYALSTHGHGSNSPNINQYMHDDRFLNINANTVPGLNVINRLNPVTANFTDGYIRGLQKYSDPDVEHSFTSMDRKTYRLTVQDVEQALSDDGIDTSDVAWLVDRLYYADRYLTEESEEKRAHGSRGLMNGEIEAVLVQAVKDLSAKIDTLEDRIATLEG